jgi:hypothetical protein
MNNIPRASEIPVYVPDKDNQMLLVKGKKAIVNEDDHNLVYCISSDRYSPPQYEETLNEMEKAIKNNPEFGDPKISLNFIDDGAKMKAIYDFPEIETDINPSIGDIISLRLTLLSAYDCSTLFSVLLGGKRLLCKNGMVGNIQMASIVKMHTKSLREQISKGFLEDTVHQFSIQTGIWKRWVNEVIGYEETKHIAETMDLGKRDSIELKEEMETKWDSDSPITKWMMFNLITAFITHKVENEKKKLRLEEKTRRAFYSL